MEYLQVCGHVGTRSLELAKVLLEPYKLLLSRFLQKPLATLAVLGIALVATPSFGAELFLLELAIIDVRPSEGLVRVELHNSAATYLSREELVPFRSASVTATDRDKITLRFEDIPAGSYAISMYQDLNSNDNLDSTFFRIPKEPFGFSNNLPVRFGPPSFEKSSFEVTSNLSIEVKLK